MTTPTRNSKKQTTTNAIQSQSDVRRAAAVPTVDPGIHRLAESHVRRREDDAPPYAEMQARREARRQASGREREQERKQTIAELEKGMSARARMVGGFPGLVLAAIERRTLRRKVATSARTLQWLFQKPVATALTQLITSGYIADIDKAGGRFIYMSVPERAMVQSNPLEPIKKSVAIKPPFPPRASG